MQRINYVNPLSLARFAALLYVPLGLFYIEYLAFQQVNDVAVPIGFYFAYFHLTLSIHVPRPTTWTGGSALVILGSLCLAITGWITGFICAIVYNFFARHFRGLRIEVKLDPSS